MKMLIQRWAKAIEKNPSPAYGYLFDFREITKLMYRENRHLNNDILKVEE